MLNNYFEQYGHKCKLHLNDPFIEYTLNKSQLRLWLMEHSVISSKFLLLHSRPRSYAALRNEILHQLKNFPYSIHPYSVITFYSETVWMVAVLIWFSIMPLDVFRNLNVTQPWRRAPEYFEMFLSFILLVDTLRRFFTGFVIQRCDSDEVVLDLKRISCHYIKRYFLADFLASLPAFLELRYLTSPNYFQGLEILSYFRLFRLFSMLRVFRNLMHFVKLNYNITEILNAIITLWFLVHWIACFSVLAGTLEQCFDPHVTHWFNDILTPSLSTFRQYLICFHRTVSILTGTGFQFIHNASVSVNDLIYTLLITILGHVITVIILAKVCEIVIGMTSASGKYDEMLNEVLQYINQRNCKQSTKEQIKTYYEYRYEHSFFRDHFIYEAMPFRLKQRVLLERNKLLMQNIKLFHKIPASVFANIVSHLAKHILLAGDIVYRSKEPGSSMYFLLAGTVAEISSSGLELSHIEDGSQFGEGVFVSKDAKRNCTVIAIETCFLYKMTLSNFVELINYCPDLIELIVKDARHRNEKMRIINERYRQLANRSLLYLSE